MANFEEFETLTAARSASIAADVKFLRTAGYRAIGDGGGALYKSVQAKPNHHSHFVTNDPGDPTLKRIWELAETHVNLFQFGARSEGSSGSFDNSRALDNALLFCKRTAARSLEVPGLFRIAKPVRDINFQIEIWGQGPNRSAFYRNYVERTMINDLNSRGLLAVTHDEDGDGSGTIIRGIGVLAMKMSQGGSAISVINGLNKSLGNVTIDDIQISAEEPDAWGGFGVVLDGSANSVDPMGLRSCKISRLNLFGDAIGSLLLRSVKYTSVLGGLYNKVPGSSGEVQVNGTETCYSEYITIVASVLNGLRLTHVKFFNLFGSIVGHPVAINDDQTAENCQVYGTVTGSITGNWTGISGIINAANAAP